MKYCTCIVVLFYLVTVALAEQIIINDTPHWQGGQASADLTFDPIGGLQGNEVEWTQTGANTASGVTYGAMWCGSDWSGLKITSSGSNTVTASAIITCLWPAVTDSLSFKTANEIQLPIIEDPPSGTKPELLHEWLPAVEHICTQDNDEVEFSVSNGFGVELSQSKEETDTVEHQETTTESVNVNGGMVLKGLSFSGGYSSSSSETVKTTLANSIGINYTTTFSSTVNQSPTNKVGDTGDKIVLYWLRTIHVQKRHVWAYPDSDKNGLADGPLQKWTVTAKTSPLTASYMCLVHTAPAGP